MVREACAGCMHAHARCMHACVLEWYVQRMHGACMHAFVPNFSVATKNSGRVCSKTTETKSLIEIQARVLESPIASTEVHHEPPLLDASGVESTREPEHDNVRAAGRSHPHFA